jgi:hypothetical protein
MSLTRDQWLERATGAYQQLSGCTDEEAEQWKKEWDGVEIDLAEDDPIASAEASFREDYETDEQPSHLSLVSSAGTGGAAG